MSLSKTRFVSGLKCHKKLWWEVHEPEAPELAAAPGLQVIFDRGHQVGDLARTYVPGGVLIDFEYYQVAEKVEATERAIADSVPVIYEASFIADDVFVAVDILERQGDSFVLVEVKSTLSVKEQYLPDVAIQLYVARGSGLNIPRAEVMYLNRECRYPDLSNLFVREDVTPLLEDDLVKAPARIQALRTMLEGPLPNVAVGAHCTTPYACPFIDRCWPSLPDHHISTLYRIHPRTLARLQEEGYETLLDLPDDFEANGAANRQLRSVRLGAPVIEPGLGDALKSLEPPIAFLDFETINPAVPVWAGCRPFQVVPVQFSCHVLDNGQLTHHAWLADGPDDPREKLARAMIAACAGARTILAYGHFEKDRVRELIEALPHLERELTALSASLRDLLAIVRDHVYHPDFHASFSIKDVLPALVPGLGYDDLEIQDGGIASAALETMLLRAGTLSPGERTTLRAQLLRYCEFDTLAMVKLYERLGELATRPTTS